LSDNWLVASEEIINSIGSYAKGIIFVAPDSFVEKIASDPHTNFMSYCTVSYSDFLTFDCKIEDTYFLEPNESSAIIALIGCLSRNYFYQSIQYIKNSNFELNVALRPFSRSIMDFSLNRKKTKNDYIHLNRLMKKDPLVSQEMNEFLNNKRLNHECLDKTIERLKCEAGNPLIELKSILTEKIKESIRVRSEVNVCINNKRKRQQTPSHIFTTPICSKNISNVIQSQEDDLRQMAKRRKIELTKSDSKKNSKKSPGFFLETSAIKKLEYEEDDEMDL
jgi:hypothetical protein